MASLLSNDKYALYYQRINLIYQRPEVKASLEIILSVFTVTILIFAAIRPTLTNIATLQRKIEDLDSVNRRADNKIAQVFNAQNQLNTYENRLPLYDEAVPDNFSYFDIAGRVELLARRMNLQVQVMSIPGTRLFGSTTRTGEWITNVVTPGDNKIIETGVSFVVLGSPGDVRVFLQEIENMDRLTFLSDVVLSTETGVTRGSQTLRAAGNIYFYFYDES